jgi:sugar phosphate isomerase/epimerase
MRFGIQILDWPIVLEQLTAKGSFDVNQFNFPSLIQRGFKQGFSLMELTGDIGYILPGTLTEHSITEVQRIKEDLDLTITVHLPLWSLEPASPNPFIRKATVKCLVDLVNLVKPLKPETYVLHATGALAAEFSKLKIPSQYREFILEGMIGLAEQSIRELLQQTGISSKQLALENIEFPFEGTWRIAERLNTSICLDTGHLLSGQSGPIEILTFLELYYDRIAEIHLHDGGLIPPKGYNGHFFDHQPLGAGELPIVEFLLELESRKFRGPIIFELTLQEAQESLKIIRQLIPDLLIE